MARKKNKKPERRPDRRAPRARRRPLRRLLMWLMRQAAYGLAILILWVGSYTVINPPGGVYMATEWWRLGKIERDWVDMDQITPDLARAAMAAEDARFCDHWGIDPDAIEKALDASGKGRRLRGASTISQQVAKNLFLWQGRSWLRKGLEAGFALAIEAIWTKRRILEVYLNVAEFGEGVFGVEAAAQHHFQRPAAKLTLDQAARLAAVLPDPKDRDPRKRSRFMDRRAAAIADGARTLEAEGRDGCIE